MKNTIVVALVALMLLLPLTLFAGGKQEEEAAPKEGAKKYEGVEITFLIQGGAAYDIPNENGVTYLEAIAQDFKEETGATVKLVGAPWENLMPKIMNDVTTGANQFDGMLFDLEFQYSIKEYLLQINDLIEEKNYNMDGFVEPVYEYGEWAGEGIRYGLPMTSGVMPVFYRTDIVDEIPDTWDKYFDMLDELKQSGQVKNPVTLPGVPAQLVKRYCCFFWTTGDKLLSSDWEPQVNNENGLWALKQFEKLIDNYCADGVLGYDNPDAVNEFMNGDAVLYENWPAFIMPHLTNPDENETVRGKWAIGAFPEGGTGNFVQHNMIIMKATEHPEAVFDYIAKCTNEENMKRGVLEFGIDVSRASVLTSPEVLEKHPYYEGYVKALNNGKHIFPGVPYWLELFMALGEGLSSYFSGEISDPQKALDNIADEWKKMIEENPLDFEYRG
jgi:ABC-type glycerol-3-phosphate transport system substrate-binding protein